MATTHRLTNVITVAEFVDVANFFVNASREGYNTEKMVDLLQKQTEAKQDKFWKYYDNMTFVCDECGKRQWKSKRLLTSKYDICSRECAIQSMGSAKMTYTVHFTNGMVSENVTMETITLHLLNATGIAYIKSEKLS